MAPKSEDEEFSTFGFGKKSPRPRTTSLAFIQSKLQRRGTGSSSIKGSISTVDAKGPLGLNLLHEPSEPRIDFIFVHGLGGGSRKTWSKSAEPGMFWPKEWLPNEVGFKHVRIHSYGYNSDWATRKESHLTIHDFGQALIADIYNSPHLRRNGDTPIVFVAHSMGGLVVKKAYMLATHDPTYKASAQRIHTMYFLGTPHRGADSAQLTKIIRYSAGHGAKAFIEDLIPGGGTVDQINDEFRHLCSNLRLWSFFEGVPTSFGPMVSLVVEKESAILGLPGEHTQYMEADHRHICKFESPVSSNYVILQRAFLTTIEELEADNLFQRRDTYRSQMKQISSFLRVDQRPDATLLAINEKQHHGSCEWLTSEEEFQEWIDDPVDWEIVDPLHKPLMEHAPGILWLNGRPGTGKSVAAAHVIKYLENCNLDCSFYFFKHNDKTGSTVASLLRSLAFQMAQSSYEVRQAIMSMIEDDVGINHEDHHVVWSKMFVDRIFKSETLKSQFWVVDALDECAQKGLPAFISMISKLGKSVPIRIFITSRPGGQLERLLTQEMTRFAELSTGSSGSLKDIELFLRAKCPQFDDGASSQAFISEVLSKSNGNFLWASLTMARLENLYSLEDMQEALRAIPSGMDEFYSRIMESIQLSPSYELAKCILKWVICAQKPLTTGELAEALKLDIDRTLTASAGQLETITGHLIFVDSDSHVHITHQTTTAFLTQQREGLWIDRSLAHARISEICLTTLCGGDFTPPRPRRATATPKRGSSPFSLYATTSFAYHLMHSSSSVDGPLVLLNKFLRSNVLTWIEKVAETADLSVLQQTARRLKAYLARRAKYQPPVSVEVQTVSAWVVDIYHIVAAFHSGLMASPSSIHVLIPHLCPPKSIIHQLFAKPTKRLRISGPLDEEWNDRLTCYLFSQEATSVACCERLLAVGVKNGDISVYHSAGFSTFELLGKINHGKKVRQLAFNKESSLLASCSVRKLTLWDVRRSNESSFPCLWSKNLQFTPCEVAFHPDGNSLILSDPQQSSVVLFRISNGFQEEPTQLNVGSDSDSSDGSDRQTSSIAAERIRIDPLHKIVALAYRNATIVLWDMEAAEKIGKFEKEGFEDVYSSPPSLDMTFNPIPDLELLAVSYKDGAVVICNPWTLDQVGEYHLPHSLVLLAATSDGRVLVGGAEDGAVHLFSFETLQPLYTIPRPDEQFRICGIAFSADNLRFFDIRGHCCNVWEPSVLIPKDRSDDSSSEPQSEEVIMQEPVTSQAHVFQWGQSITTIHPTDGSLFFVGRQNGTVDICDINTGAAVDNIALHDRFTEIQHLAWNEAKRILVSVDVTGRCIVSHLPQKSKGEKQKIDRLLDHRERKLVGQVMVCSDGGSILICSDANIKLLAVAGGSVKGEIKLPGSFLTSHPTDPKLFVALQSEVLHLFRWDSLEHETDTRGVVISGFTTLLATGNEAWFGCAGSTYLARGLAELGCLPSGFAALDASKLNSSTTEVKLQTQELNTFKVQAILGVLKSSLYFLDAKGWVCSVSLKSLQEAIQYTRHFFIPPTWHTGGDVVIRILSKSAVAFARNEQLFVFHGFLEFEEKVAMVRPDSNGTGESILAIQLKTSSS
ncbi:hypothetical protein QBC35DRAFT_501687 [Podospora australis]|uniref:GPI inositol-deacylase n=1 Tax=Podospora australis TaxID=1536484 RepID=A0AAN7AHJ6_9PEZI|nr:hypothetical protein QBC35DRAFT_501687 [Podospora australis]